MATTPWVVGQLIDRLPAAIAEADVEQVAGWFGLLLVGRALGEARSRVTGQLADAIGAVDLVHSFGAHDHEAARRDAVACRRRTHRVPGPHLRLRQPEAGVRGVRSVHRTREKVGLVGPSRAGKSTLF